MSLGLPLSAQLLTGCVTVGQCPNFSVPLFLHLQKKDKKSTHLTGLLKDQMSSLKIVSGT